MSYLLTMLLCEVLLIKHALFFLIFLVLIKHASIYSYIYFFLIITLFFIDEKTSQIYEVYNIIKEIYQQKII